MSKGIFWMNPSTNGIKVDLKQKYEHKYDYIIAYELDISSLTLNPLTYLIEKAKVNVKLEFK